MIKQAKSSFPRVQKYEFRTLKKSYKIDILDRIDMNSIKIRLKRLDIIKLLWKETNSWNFEKH
jgi:hypothetical protein